MCKYRDSLAKLQIPSPVHTDIAARLPYSIHNLGLIHHVPLPERDLLLEMIGKELSAYVNPTCQHNSHTVGRFAHLPGPLRAAAHHGPETTTAEERKLTV